MKIGLFFGSFNPIHIGHLIIANFMATNTDLDKTWIVVSPHNPLKEKKSLANNNDRYHWATLATEDNPLLDVSNIEFNLPQPSFTIDTLEYLREKYPKHEFVLIMGSDNIDTFHKWKNYKQILSEYKIYVYKRPNTNLENKLFNHDSIMTFEAPFMQISASFIRKLISNNKSIKYLVPDEVIKDIELSHAYK